MPKMRSPYDWKRKRKPDRDREAEEPFDYSPDGREISIQQAVCLSLPSWKWHANFGEGLGPTGEPSHIGMSHGCVTVLRVS